MKPIRTIHYYEDGTEFPVDWSDPEDAKYTYQWNTAHNPYPLTPLSVDLLDKLNQEQGMRDHMLWCREGLANAPNPLLTHPHGYWYLHSLERVNIPTSQCQEGLTPLQLRALQQAPQIKDIWQKEYVPLIKANCHQIRTGNYAAMTATQLTTQLPQIFDLASRMFGLTMYATPPMFQCHQWLHKFVQGALGIDDEALVAMMEHGIPNETAASQILLWELAQQVRNCPEVSRIFKNYSANELLAVLPGVEGGPEFITAFQRYLDKYGWRPEMWLELSIPTWREEPASVLRIIQRYLAGEDPDPHVTHLSAVRNRRNAVRRLSGRLRNQPEKLAEFKSLLTRARQYLPVREGRGNWQLIIGGSLRVPCLILGEKLASQGILKGADDIFYFRLDELEQLVSSSGDSNWSQLAQERQQERQHRMRTSPPAIIGRIPESNEAGRSDISSNERVKEEAPSEGRLLRGKAASAGVAQATARVILYWEEADKVQPGDILVCR
ncbi:MAG: hypothetical protein ACE5Q6_12405, partial [Dehalococcoidia bacterium]